MISEIDPAEVVGLIVASLAFFVLVVGGVFVVTWRFFQRTDITSRPLPDLPALRPLLPLMWSGTCVFVAVLWLFLATGDTHPLIPIIVLLMAAASPAWRLPLRWWARHRGEARADEPPR